jgi:hypothetical protein
LCHVSAAGKGVLRSSGRGTSQHELQFGEVLANIGQVVKDTQLGPLTVSLHCLSVVAIAKKTLLCIHNTGNVMKVGE